MARVITGTYMARTQELTAGERRRAQVDLQRRARKNKLRRVHLECETSGQRDATAVVGDRVWCDRHADFATVVTVVE